MEPIYLTKSAILKSLLELLPLIFIILATEPLFSITHTLSFHSILPVP